MTTTASWFVRLLLALLISSLHSAALAELNPPLGRLFSLPSEREQLNRLRLQAKQPTNPTKTETAAQTVIKEILPQPEERDLASNQEASEASMDAEDDDE